jgi:hypothetical protein
MRTLRLVLAFLIVLACGVPAAHAGPVPAVATYSANLTVSLTFPVIPLLGVASLNDAFLPNAVCLAMGVAGNTSCTNPTSRFAANTLTFTAGPVAGFAGPGVGFASGVSFGTSETILLTNLTGAPLVVPLMGTYNYSLATTAIGMTSAGAAVSFQIDERLMLGGMPTTLFSISDAIVSPPNNSKNVNGNFMVNTMNIPNNGSLLINIDPFASGDAKSPTPEPSAFVPLLTLATAGWLKRKWLSGSK